MTDNVVREFAMRCPVPLPPGERVMLGHGSGGKLAAQLIRDLFVPVLGDATPSCAARRRRGRRGPGPGSRSRPTRSS